MGHYRRSESDFEALAAENLKGPLLRVEDQAPVHVDLHAVEAKLLLIPFDRFRGPAKPQRELFPGEVRSPLKLVSNSNGDEKVLTPVSTPTPENGAKTG